MTFRFRAAAALDLQRKREDEARLALARAEAAVEAAALRVAEADQAIGREGDDFIAVQRGGAPAWLLTWHRSWIDRQHQERDARRQEVAAAREAADRAAAAVREAHRRRRTLERLRDRAWRRHQLESDRHDTRQINELAGLRFVAQRAAEQGETDGEHQQHRPDERPERRRP
jgi:flagellar export protein FliJ